MCLICHTYHFCTRSGEIPLPFLHKPSTSTYQYQHGSLTILVGIRTSLLNTSASADYNPQYLPIPLPITYHSCQHHRSSLTNTISSTKTALRALSCLLITQSHQPVSYKSHLPIPLTITYQNHAFASGFNAPDRYTAPSTALILSNILTDQIMRQPCVRFFVSR